MNAFWNANKTKRQQVETKHDLHEETFAAYDFIRITGGYYRLMSVDFENGKCTWVRDRWAPLRLLWVLTKNKLRALFEKESKEK